MPRVCDSLTHPDRQQWTSCEVSWITGYSLTKFVIDVKKQGKVVIVLAQVRCYHDLIRAVVPY